jgi:hypothetical protein
MQGTLLNVPAGLVVRCDDPADELAGIMEAVARSARIDADNEMMLQSFRGPARPLRAVEVEVPGSPAERADEGRREEDVMLHGSGSESVATPAWAKLDLRVVGLPRLQMLFDFLPESLRVSLAEYGQSPTPETLAYLCEDTDDEIELSIQETGSADIAPLLRLLRDEARLHASRRVKRRVALGPVAQLALLLARPTETEPAPDWGPSLNDTGALMRRKVWPTKYSQAKETAGPQARQLLESAERTRWVDRLVQVLQCLGMPVCETAERSMDPARTLRAAAGCARPRTIRKRIKEWEKMSHWLEVIHQVQWPATDGQLIDYLHERLEEPCSRSVPQGILSMISFLEKCGGVESPDSLAGKSVIRKAFDQAEMILAEGCPVPKKANMFPLLLVVAMELAVMDECTPRYIRCLAWFRLTKLWASMRFDDTLGLAPSSFRMHETHLEGILQRTKSSGAGRKVRWLSIYIDKGATLSGEPWLERGYELWCQEGMSFDRDYLLPLPAEGMQTCRPTPASYTEATTMGRLLLGLLRKPCWDERSWYLGEERLLTVREASLFWSEHSERCWATSLAILINIPKEHRDFLGRWSVTGCSDEYLRTAAQLVRETQRKIAKAIQVSNIRFDQQLILDNLYEFLQSKCADEEGISITCSNLRWPIYTQDVPLMEPLQESASLSAVVHEVDDLVDTPLSEPLQRSPSPGEGVHEVDDEDDTKFNVKPFFLCYTLKRRRKRLHRAGGCGSWPGINIGDFEEFEDLAGVEYDDYCHHCWRKGTHPDKLVVGSNPAEVMVSSGEDSDSTDSSGDSSSASHD